MSALQIGIVAGADLHRHMLKKLLLELGYGAQCINSQQLIHSLKLHLPDEIEEQPDAWLLDSSDPDVDELVEHIVQNSNTPFLINDECPPAQPEALAAWRRRMHDKLDELAASLAAGPFADADTPEEVWVLAASTGGPEAVGEFLSALAPNLPVAFVYAQHIDAGFDRVLNSALEKQEHYRSKLCRGEQHLRKGTILVVPADRQLRFLPFHRVLETRKEWEGRYQPALDQVIGQVARMYQQRCGVIIFTGLCDDGALGARVTHACGGTVWVQTPATCVNSSMPDAALATGVVSRQGSPKELALALNNRYSQQTLTGRLTKRADLR